MLFFLSLVAILVLVVVLGPARERLRSRYRPADERCVVRGADDPIEHAPDYSLAQRLGLGRFRRAPTLADRGHAEAVRAAREQAHDAHALPLSLAEGTAVAHDGHEMADEIAPAAGGHAAPRTPPGLTPANDRPAAGAGPDARQVPPP